MSVSDVSVVIDSNDDYICDLALSEPFSMSYQRQLSKASTGKFSLLIDDSQRASLRKRSRVAMVHNDSSRVLFSGEVRTITDTHVIDGEEVAMQTVYDLVDDLGALDSSTMRPWQNFPNGSSSDLARRPTTPERRIGWMDPTYPAKVAYDPSGTLLVPVYRTPGWDGVQWKHAVQLYKAGSQAASPAGRFGRPNSFVDPDAWWIWSRALVANAHPEGDNWFHKYFAINPGAKGLCGYVAGDDAYDVWFNGVQMAATPNNESDEAFMKTKRFIVRRTASELGFFGHVLVRVRNQGGGGNDDHGGLLMTIRELGTNNLVTHTDASWSCTDYPGGVGTIPPTTMPGWPAGLLPITLANEGKARNLLDGSTSILERSTFDFTETAQTGGGAWPNLTDVPLSDGSTLLSALDKITQQVEFCYEPRLGIPKYQMYSGKDVSLIGGGTGTGKGSTLAVALEKGVNAEEITQVTTTDGESTECFANCIIYRWRAGIGEVSNPTSIAGPWGKVEKFLPLGAMLEEAAARDAAVRMLAITSEAPITYSVMIADDAGVMPGIDFDIGDTIHIVYDGNDIPLRVMAHGGDVDDDGFLTPTVEVGHPRDVIEGRFAQWLSNISIGNDAAFTTTTPADGVETTFIEVPQISTQGNATPETARVTLKSMDASLRSANVGFADIQTATPGSTATVMQLYVNGVPKESLTLPAGQTYAYANFSAGTGISDSDLIHVVWVSTGTGMTLPNGRFIFREVA